MTQLPCIHNIIFFLYEIIRTRRIKWCSYRKYTLNLFFFLFYSFFSFQLKERVPGKFVNHSTYNTDDQARVSKVRCQQIAHSHHKLEGYLEKTYINRINKSVKFLQPRYRFRHDDNSLKLQRNLTPLNHYLFICIFTYFRMIAFK